MNRTKALTIMATLPPPVTGMTLATKAVAGLLEKRCRLRMVRINADKYNSGVAWRAAKGLIVLKLAWRILLGRQPVDDNVYLVANSGFGLLYNLLLIVALREKRIFLHHHVYAYLTKRSILMNGILALMKRNGIHIFLDRSMCDKMQETYRQEVSSLILSNTILMDDMEDEPVTKEYSGTLGFLSNISFDKGIAEVCETFAFLRDAGHDVTLRIAGPCVSADVENYLRRQQERFGDRLVQVGPVYGSEKDAFFEEVSLFLFPTKYANEAQPLVVLEALRGGIPVVATNLGCLPDLHDGRGCLIVASDRFTSTVNGLILSWLKEPQGYISACSFARNCWEENRNASKSQLDFFIESLS